MVDLPLWKIWVSWEGWHPIYNMEHLFFPYIWVVVSNIPYIWYIWLVVYPIFETTNQLPIGSMYAIYGNIYHQYTPSQMLAYIPAPWILWAMVSQSFPHHFPKDLPFGGLIGQDSDVLLQILPQVFPAAHAAGHRAIKTSTGTSSGRGSQAWPGLVNIEKAIENGHRHYDIVNCPMKNDDFP